jgi:hypothetical protein
MNSVKLTWILLLLSLMSMYFVLGDSIITDTIALIIIVAVSGAVLGGAGILAAGGNVTDTITVAVLGLVFGAVYGAIIYFAFAFGFVAAFTIATTTATFLFATATFLVVVAGAAAGIGGNFYFIIQGIKEKDFKKINKALIKMLLGFSIFVYLVSLD